MPITYTTEKRACYVLVKTTGITDKPKDMICYIRDVVADCKQQGAHKVLLDHRQLQFERKSSGTYDVALGALEHLDPSHPMQVALLSRPEEMQFVHAYEYMGLGRGLNLKAFEREQMAKAWLDCEFCKMDLIKTPDSA